MRAVVVAAHGGLEQLRVQDRPLPVPAAGEVRVAIRAAGLNHLDVWVRRGVPGHAFPLPLIPGSDGAGVIDAIGAGVDSVAVGDAVMVLPGVSCGSCPMCSAGRDQLCAQYGILGETRDGCCAEAVVVPAVNVVAKPANLTFPEAAAFTLSFLTAWSMLAKAQLVAGETILIHGGASGVGSAAIQIARLRGAQVLTTAGTAEKLAAALRLGADHGIDYRAEDFVAAVRRIRGRAGVDVVFEHVGGSTFDGSVRCLARGGRLVTCGATDGNADVTINLRRLFFKNLALIGSTMGSRAEALQVIELAAAGKLRPLLDGVLPLAEIGKAHEKLESRTAIGKVVVTP